MECFNGMFQWPTQSGLRLHYNVDIRFIFVMTLKLGSLHMSVRKCSPIVFMTWDLGRDMTMIRRDYVLVRAIARGYILVKNMIISRN